MQFSSVYKNLRFKKLLSTRNTCHMPKLDGTHIADRLRKRLDQLQNGEEVAARDIRALLTDVQLADIEAAWAEQQALRNQSRVTTPEAQVALGWKTKREIHIAALAVALKQAEDNEVKAWEQKQANAEIRQMRIYMDTLGAALATSEDIQTAKNKANNALTRAGLRRMDGQHIQRLNRRDQEMWDMEQQLLKKMEDELDEQP